LEYPASKEFQPQMNADKLSTAGARLASISHILCFLSAFICDHPWLNISSYLSGLVYGG
jgi:hypothetical protein